MMGKWALILLRNPNNIYEQSLTDTNKYVRGHYKLEIAIDNELNATNVLTFLYYTNGLSNKF